MKNRTVDFYIERAKDNSGASSDRKLGTLLGLSEIAVSNWRNGRSWPSDDVMVKLSKICGIDPDIGLLDLNLWRSSGDAKEAYARMLKKITVVIMAMIILVSSGNSAIAKQPDLNMEAHSHSIIETIHYHIRLLWLRLMKLLF